MGSCVVGAAQLGVTAVLAARECTAQKGMWPTHGVHFSKRNRCSSARRQPATLWAPLHPWQTKSPGPRADSSLHLCTRCPRRLHFPPQRPQHRKPPSPAAVPVRRGRGRHWRGHVRGGWHAVAAPAAKPAAPAKPSPPAPPKPAPSKPAPSPAVATAAAATIPAAPAAAPPKAAAHVHQLGRHVLARLCHHLWACVHAGRRDVGVQVGRSGAISHCTDRPGRSCTTPSSCTKCQWGTQDLHVHVAAEQAMAGVPPVLPAHARLNPPLTHSGGPPSPPAPARARAWSPQA